MKTKHSKTAALLVASGLMMHWGCGPEKTTAVAISSHFPQNVKQSCVVTQDDFNNWFVSGQVSENGAVKPANSVTFQHRNNCDFYQWSWQMFLWMTSPAKEEGYSLGNGKTVMESQVFYTVTPQDSDGNRTLIPHKPGEPLRVNSNISQAGPHQLPIMMDKQGRVFEVEKPKPGEKTMLRNATGKLVEIDHLETGANGEVLFVDKAGKQIQKPKLLKGTKDVPPVVREFTSNGKTVLLDKNGNIVDTEVGQATGDALIAQNGSLVYYITMVNDMYAYFLTGAKNGALYSGEFPTTAGARDSILEYGKQNGWPTPPDPDALAIEIKSSWVEVKDLPNAETYLTIDAIVPEYDKSNPKLWVPVSERKAKLALIGLHVVGSLAGHPEMSWATFEHFKNAPNSAYTYLDSLNNVDTIPADGGTGWLLTADAGATSVNNSYITVGHDTLYLDTTNATAIGASNTKMMKPFGVAPDQVPNAENTSVADANSEVISINNSVLNKLAQNDIRKNYFMVGATWTSGGHGPNGVAYPANNASLHDAIGTSQLANSTMETYFQFGELYSANGSCFRCHSGDSTLVPGDLSHVYDQIIVLPPMQKK
jgi:hypothetical protein